MIFSGKRVMHAAWSMREHNPKSLNEAENIMTMRDFGGLGYTAAWAT